MTREEIAALAEAAGILGGMAEPGETPQIDASGDRCRIAYTPDCILLRAPFPSEGHDTPRVVMKPGDEAGNRRKVEAFLARTATLQARERAVSGHGTEHSPYPAWSFAVDGIVAAIAARDGFDLASSARPSAWRRTVEPYHGRIASREAAWNWSRERHHVKGASDMGVGGGRITYPEMKGERLAMALYNPAIRICVLT